MAVQPFVAEGYDFDSLMERVEYFADLLLKHGLLAFREVHLTRAEHGTFFRALGMVYNHFKVPGQHGHDHPEPEPDFVGLTEVKDYSWRGETAQFLAESHGQGQAFKNECMEPLGGWDNAKDGRSSINTFLPWHIECPHREWPQIAAAWTMPWKICPPEQGATLFCDYQDLYNTMDEDLQEFLRTEPAYIKAGSDERRYIDGYSAAISYNGEIIRPVALPHPVTGKYSIRHHLILATGFIREGTDEQMFRFKEVVREYTNNNNNHYFWEWTIGDLLVVDLWRMAHTVSDFPLGERTMVGTWGYDAYAPDHP